MKIKYTWLSAMTMIVCFLALTIYGQKQTATRTTWEYKAVTSISGDLAFVLNDLGAQGWELVAADVTTPQTGFKGTTYYLKRAK